MPKAPKPSAGRLQFLHKHVRFWSRNKNPQPTVMTGNECPDHLVHLEQFHASVVLRIGQDRIPFLIPFYCEFGTSPVSRQVLVGMLIFLTIFGCDGFREPSWPIPMNSLTHLRPGILRPFLHDWFFLPSGPNHFHGFGTELMIKVVAVRPKYQVKINQWKLPETHLAIPRVPMVS